MAIRVCDVLGISNRCPVSKYGVGACHGCILNQLELRDLVQWSISISFLGPSGPSIVAPSLRSGRYCNSLGALGLLKRIHVETLDSVSIANGYNY